IAEEWLLLLSGVQRRVIRLSVDLHVAGRLALRRTTRICAGRWRGRDGACVGDCGEAHSGTSDDASGSDGGCNEADEVARHGCVHLSFPLRLSVWFSPHRCRCRTFVRELVTAPKLRIRRRRVAVVLTTRVTGDLRLLRILAIDPGQATSRTTTQRNRWGADGI